MWEVKVLSNASQFLLIAVIDTDRLRKCQQTNKRIPHIFQSLNKWRRDLFGVRNFIKLILYRI